MIATETASSASAFKAGSDELGAFAQVSVDPGVFSDTAIFKTAYWYTDHHYVYFSRDSVSQRLIVELRLKQGEDVGQLKKACGEFWNKLLDFQLRERVLAETRVIRETLVKKAFFEAKAPLPASAVSNESLLLPAAASTMVSDESRKS